MDSGLDSPTPQDVGADLGAGLAPQASSAPTRQERRVVTLLWLGWIIILLLFQAAAGMRLNVIGPDTGYGWTDTYSTDPPPTGIGLSHVRWDSYHYLRLAQAGYHQTVDAAYYPGYPFLTRIVALGLIDPLRSGPADGEVYAAGGLAVSLIASLVVVWTMHQLSRDLLADDDDALRATFYLLIFPTALFLTQVYTESLYLALSTPALLLMVRRRWWAAGILAALATLTRPTGLLLIGPMAVYWWTDWRTHQNPSRRAWIALLLPLLAWGGFALALRSVGLSITEAERQYGRVLLKPGNIQIILNDLGYMLTHRMGAIQIALDVLLPLLAGWGCWRARHEWPGFALYGAGSLLLPLLTGQLVSMNRYALIVLPMYWGLARAGRRPLIDKLWTLISVLLLALYLVGFAHGYWTG